MSDDERVLSLLQLLSTQQSQLMRRMDAQEEQMKELNASLAQQQQQQDRLHAMALLAPIESNGNHQERAAEEDDCVSWFKDLLYICCHC